MMIRPRRLRQAQWIRDLLSEHALTAQDLILPVFVIDGQNTTEDIPSLPGVQRKTMDLLAEDLKQYVDMGLRAAALFPVTPEDKKDETGSESHNPDNLICRTLHYLKKEVPHIGLITDVALDPYTSHGHDGLLKDGEILNDETVEILCKQSLVQAQAGADIIAPSDMMDGRVAAIRQTLDVNDLHNIMIMSYAAKYASCFYGPFRDAVQSGGKLQGDKKTYQMDPANSNEAMREIALDIDEGADMAIIKPGLPYLDIISKAHQSLDIPLFAYHVSGEYAMLKAADQNGWLNYEQGLFETLLSFKRAGCTGILSYGAIDALHFLNTNSSK